MLVMRLEWTAALVHTVLMNDVEGSDCFETVSSLLGIAARSYASD